MITFAALQNLHQAGRLEEARAMAVRAMASPNNAERQSGAIYVIHNILFDLFSVALAVLKEMQPQIEHDLTSCNALAYAAWVTNEIDLCRWASKRCIALNPGSSSGYMRLGLAELGREQYRWFLRAFGRTFQLSFGPSA